MSLPMVFTGDPGTDDAVALTLAAQHFKKDMKLLMASFGNVTGKTSYRNMRDLKALLGFECPVVPTSEVPVICDPLPITDYHGKNGLGNVILPLSDEKDFEGDSFKTAAEVICSYDKIILASAGPVTDIAILFEKHPEVKGHISEVVLMGGGFEIFNVDHNTEYNFYTDPDAVRIMLEGGVKFVFAPLDITMKTALSEKDLEYILGVDSIRGDFDSSAYGCLAKILIANYDTGMAHGCNGGILHDALIFTYIARPELFRFEDKKVGCDKYGSVFFADNGADVRVLEEIDQNAFIEFVKSAFTQLKQG